MARDTRQIFFEFLGDSRNLERATQRGQRSVSGFERGMKTAAGAAATFGVALGAQEVIRWTQDAVQLAVAADEVDSKFQEVFGTATELQSGLEAWGDMAGVTTTQAQDLAATFGNLAQAQGISATASQRLALDVAELAGDMASFNDEDPARVFTDLNKALLTTEREGMKKYGIAITEAEVKTRAATIAAEDGRSEVTKADRAYASYAIAVEQAGSAIGDLERTQDSAANQQRQLRASITELQEEIGQELLPVYEDLLNLAVALAPALRGVTGEVSRLSDMFQIGENPLQAYRSQLELLFPPLRAVTNLISGPEAEGKQFTKGLRESKEAALELNDELERMRSGAKEMTYTIRLVPRLDEKQWATIEARLERAGVLLTESMLQNLDKGFIGRLGRQYLAGDERARYGYNNGLGPGTDTGNGAIPQVPF